MSILCKSYCTDPLLAALIEWLEEQGVHGHYNDKHDTFYPRLNAALSVSLDLWCDPSAGRACLSVRDGAVKIETYGNPDLRSERFTRLSDPSLFDQLVVMVKSIGAAADGK